MSAPVRILTAAGLHWRNGHEYALQAAQLLAQRSFPFSYRIVGSGPFLEAVAFARHQLGIEDRVALLTDAPEDAARREIEECDVFLLACVADGAEHALDEALARGIPVVCTDLPGLRGRIREGIDGFVVPRRDPRAIADCLAEQLPRLLAARGRGAAGP